MGLDMYLRKNTYIGANYEHNKITGAINLQKDGVDITFKTNRISSIVEMVGYWRKANQIHNWFVKHVQEGEDDCGEYYVSKEQLKRLLNDCKEVLANKDKAETSLPTTSGFFFGGTEYDEYYFNEIQYTIDIIEPLLIELEDSIGDIYYQSSW